MRHNTSIVVFDRDLQIKYGLPPDANLVTVLEKIEEEVDRAIWSEQDNPKWPDLIRDYREIRSRINFYSEDIFQRVCNF